MDSAMSSESITSLSQGQLHGVDAARRLQSCIFANGTTGIKCDGQGACADLPADVEVGCGSCVGNYACAFMEGVLPLPITAALEIACYMGDATIADNSCVRVDACANMGGATIANNSCARSNACLSMGNDGIVNENSCNGYQACNQLIGTGENSTDIGENSW